MKREILFRGKAIDNTFSIEEKEAKIKIGDWVYGAVIPFYDGIDLIYERDPNNPKICGCHGIEVDHNTIGQFTGLYDKNGKEIYEGDVIRFYMLDGISNDVFEEPETLVKEKIREVVYEDGSFMAGDDYVGFLTDGYRVPKPDKDCFRYTSNLNEFPFIKDENDLYYAEVIGNIYDNKELLTQPK